MTNALGFDRMKRLLVIGAVVLLVVATGYAYSSATGHSRYFLAPLVVPGLIIAAELPEASWVRHIAAVGTSSLIWTLVILYLVSLRGVLRTRTPLRKTLAFVAVSCLLLAVVSHLRVTWLASHEVAFDRSPFFWFLLPGALLDIYLSGNIHGAFPRPYGEIVEVGGSATLWSLAVWHLARGLLWLYQRFSLPMNRLTTP